MQAGLPYKISVLLFILNEAGELLLMQRRKHPNFGLWSCIGGKLEMATGESPYEAACREALEETGLALTEADLHLFAMVAEKQYEGETHWLMFLFHCKRRIGALPPEIDEGPFAFHRPEAIASLPVPETDRALLWPLYFKKRDGFTALRVDCTPGRPVSGVVEEEQS